MRTDEPLFQIGASSAEQDLIAIYSSVLRGLSPSVSLPLTSYGEYLRGKVYWTIHVAKDGWQVKWGLEMVCALVNKKENGEFPFHLSFPIGTEFVKTLKKTSRGSWRKYGQRCRIPLKTLRSDAEGYWFIST